MRRWLATIVVTLSLVWTHPVQAHSKPSFIRSAHWAVALCESRGNFRHEVHRRDGWWGGGAWSWYGPTWRLDRYRGMPSLPWLANPRQQYKVFLRSISRGRYFGCMAIAS